MEQFNKVELRGVVGNVRDNVVGDKVITRFTVATNLAYKTSDGCPVIETTWHNVLNFSDSPLGIQKGDSVSVTGRIKNQRYTDSDGNEKSLIEILANKIEKINTTLKMEE